MLANGAKLYIATTGVAAVPSTHAAANTISTELPGLKEIPDMGADPELVDNTCLSDAFIMKEKGIGDPGNMEYKFKLVNTAATDSYRILRTAESGGLIHAFREVLSDGTTSVFYGYPTVKRNGGGVNAPLEFTLSIGLQSSFDITDPA